MEHKDSGFTPEQLMETAVHGGIVISSLWALGVSGHQPHHCDVGRQMNAGCLKHRTVGGAVLGSDCCKQVTSGGG